MKLPNLLRSIFRREGDHTVRRFVMPIERSRRASAKDAAWAVGSDVRLSEYLPYRLAWYQRERPQDDQPLPLSVGVSEGDIVVAPNRVAATDRVEGYLGERLGPCNSEVSDPVLRQLRFLSAVNPVEAKTLLEDLHVADDERRCLTTREKSVSSRDEQDAAALHAAVADETAIVPTTHARPTQERGRPKGAFPWGIIGIWFFTVLTVLAEAYQFALPYFDRVGIDASNLAIEWQKNPWSIVAAAGFAIGAAAILFILAHWCLDAALSVYRNEGDRRQKILNGVGAFVLVVAIAVAASGIGSMRHTMSVGALEIGSASPGDVHHDEAGKSIFLVLTFLMPFAIASLHQVIRRRRNERAAQRTEIEEWDHSENKLLECRERLEELGRVDDAEKEAIRARNEAVGERILNIGGEMADAELAVRDRIETERRYAWAFVTSLIAALEQDKFFFIAAARRNGRVSLIGEEPHANAHPVSQPVFFPHNGNGHIPDAFLDDEEELQ